MGRVVNECGWDDSVLVLCQSTALLMGMAGRIGFHGMVGEQFINRYYRCGHGGYFDREQRFMREQMAAAADRRRAGPAHDERPPLTALGGVRLFLLTNMQFIKVAVACLLLVAASSSSRSTGTARPSIRSDAERLNHIALLTNAQEIPGRDPATSATCSRSTPRPAATRRRSTT